MNRIVGHSDQADRDIPVQLTISGSTHGSDFTITYVDVRCLGKESNSLAFQYECPVALRRGSVVTSEGTDAYLDLIFQASSQSVVTIRPEPILGAAPVQLYIYGSVGVRFHDDVTNQYKFVILPVMDSQVAINTYHIVYDEIRT